jgi:hypothetical protein
MLLYRGCAVPGYVSTYFENFPTIEAMEAAERAQQPAWSLEPPRGYFGKASTVSRRCKVGSGIRVNGS